MSDQKMIVISYVPLLYKEAGNLYRDNMIEEIAKEVDQSNSGRADGVAWTFEDGKSSPTLIMNKATEIAQHLKAWAENNPSEWFTFHYMKENGKYAIVLMPNIRASVERHGKTMKDLVGVDYNNPNVSVVFRPIHFVSTGVEAFSQAEGDIGEEITVYAVDTDIVNKENFKPNVLSHRVEIGKFKVVKEGIAQGYLADLLKDE